MTFQTKIFLSSLVYIITKLPLEGKPSCKNKVLHTEVGIINSNCYCLHTLGRLYAAYIWFSQPGNEPCALDFLLLPNHCYLVDDIRNTRKEKHMIKITYNCQV